MAIGTVAGTIISISAAAPATFNEAGYEALTWSAIGEITDGGEHGREYAEVLHNPIATRGTQKFKGSFNEGTKTVVAALDDDDAGQVIVKAALNDDDNASFKVLYPDGSADYFQAKVMSYKKGTGTVDTMRTATMNLSITTTSTGIGIVEVPA